MRKSFQNLFFLIWLGLGSAVAAPPPANCTLQDPGQPTFNYQAISSTQTSVVVQVTCDRHAKVTLQLNSVATASGGLTVTLPATGLVQTLQVHAGVPARVNWPVTIPAGQWGVHTGPAQFFAQVQLTTP